MYGLYGLKHHTVEMSQCGTDGRTTNNEQGKIGLLSLWMLEGWVSQNQKDEWKTIDRLSDDPESEWSDVKVGSCVTSREVLRKIKTPFTHSSLQNLDKGTRIVCWWGNTLWPSSVSLSHCALLWFHLLFAWSQLNSIIWYSVLFCNSSQFDFVCTSFLS